ncbi:hypothetical protein ACKWTF_002853 [Chironomus riparius]
MQLLFLFVLTKIVSIYCQQTFLDVKFGPLLKNVQIFMVDLLKPKNFELQYTINMRNGKTQPIFDGPFFCPIDGSGKRSESRPASVHRLTPGDIDVVAAMGDSLTTANGALANYELQTALEYRGISWSGGGKDNWRRYITLPNLIKVYNPNVYGYSEFPFSMGYQRESKFNVAEPGALTSDISLQAMNLVKRMKSDIKVDIRSHWKIITITIGANDFCSQVCFYDDQEKLIKDAERNIINSLRIIRDNLPRTLLNLVIPFDVGLLLTFKQVPRNCKVFHYAECQCLKSLTQFRKIKRTMKTIKIWRDRIARIPDMKEFHYRDDFEINLIKFIKDMRFAETRNNKTDYTFFAEDCFHLSQKGQSYLQ